MNKLTKILSEFEKDQIEKADELYNKLQILEANRDKVNKKDRHRLDGAWRYYLKQWQEIVFSPYFEFDSKTKKTIVRVNYKA